MPTINDYIQVPAVFEPEIIAVMGDAYERALKSLPTSAPKSVREVIAARIMDLAKTGESDSRKLCDECLATLHFLYDRR
jgi:hypothetical protein